MRSPSNQNLPSAYSSTSSGSAFSLQSDATPSDQIAQPTMATSTSLSAATPRICQPLPHETASLMEAANVHDTLDATEPLTCAADVKQFPEAVNGALQPAATQSSQLESMLLNKLPRELRDKIYREAVVEDNDILIYVTRYDTKDGEHRRRLEIGHTLLGACKQTRQEVADIYYLENTFLITEDLVGKRAIRELSRLLTPWAERMTKLGVSQKLVRGTEDFAKIKFSISTSQGHIFVKPESFSAQEMSLMLDIGSGTMDHTKLTFSKMCFCKIFMLALEHDGRNVISWMEGYVDLVLQSFTEIKRLPHCWTCAGHIIF